VIGAGLIAQVMHLHYLRELADLFEISAICDVAPANAAASCAAIKPGTECGAIPEKLAVIARATVTDGLANEVEAVNQ